MGSMLDRAASLGCATAVALAMGCATPAPTGYAPGLGEIMTLTQMRHSKLWLAGEAGNWPLADYEIDELEEGFADAARFHPTHKEAPRPLTELIPEFTQGALENVRNAVRLRDARAFVTAYDELTEACNACHHETGFAFNVVVRPTSNPYSNQHFGLGQ